MLKLFPVENLNISSVLQINFLRKLWLDDFLLKKRFTTSSTIRSWTRGLMFKRQPPQDHRQSSRRCKDVSKCPWKKIFLANAHSTKKSRGLASCCSKIKSILKIFFGFFSPDVLRTKKELRKKNCDRHLVWIFWKKNISLVWKNWKKATKAEPILKMPSTTTTTTTTTTMTTTTASTMTDTTTTTMTDTTTTTKANLVFTKQ